MLIMGDDESSENEKPVSETAPYKFKQKDEGVGKKLDRSFSNVSANKKTIAIIAGIFILVVVGGTLTGNVIKTTSDLNKCQTSLTTSYIQSAELSNNVSLLEGTVSDLSDNLSSTIIDMDKCEENYTSCVQVQAAIKNEKLSLAADLADLNQKISKAQNDLSSCNGDLNDAKSSLDQKLSELDKISNDMDQIEKKYATYKCCAFYQEGYKFYSVAGSELVCCYQGANGYFCGFGPSEQQAEEGQIKSLSC
jgi:hypothetical protein